MSHLELVQSGFLLSRCAMAADDVEAMEAQLAQLRKRKLELTKELQREKKKRTQANQLLPCSKSLGLT